MLFCSSLSCFELVRTTRSPRTPERGRERSSWVARRRDAWPSHETATASVPRRYSLQWFQALFVAAISKAEKAETLELRLDVLNTFFTYYVYVNVCRR